MSRVHDMGGRFGDGPVDPGEEPVFQESWHGRALALTLAAGALGQWNLDISRHARERLSPRDYMSFSYYEKWIAGLADLLVSRGVITRDELSGGEITPSDLAARCLRAPAVARVLGAGGPVDRDGAAPRFQPGDRVRARGQGNVFVDGGHTRLPGYVAGKTGEIVLVHGCHVFPDAHAHGQGERPEPLYTVVFQAAEVWQNPEQAGDEITCDLWESYLEPVA
ncbi:MAG: nitrile hydratase subunit beta [Pelagimonas sp.]|jgi:nitrile hydratase|nr:nitrile hydratase subunit beta [Pelagimonas sp.]